MKCEVISVSSKNVKDYGVSTNFVRALSPPYTSPPYTKDVVSDLTNAWESLGHPQKFLGDIVEKYRLGPSHNT